MASNRRNVAGFVLTDAADPKALDPYTLKKKKKSILWPSAKIEQINKIFNKQFKLKPEAFKHDRKYF